MPHLNLADHLAIRNLYASYTFAVDDHDVDGVAGCYTQDASVEVSSFALMRVAMAAGKVPFVDDDGWVRGLSAIRQMTGAAPADVVLQHLCCNVEVLHIEGACAAARAAFVVITNSGAVEHFGRYLDKLEKGSDGAWRFSERRSVARYERDDTSWFDDAAASHDG